MIRNPLRIIGIGLALLILAAAGIYQIPSIKDRLDWKWEIAIAYVDGVLNPAGALPPSLPLPHVSHQPMPGATSTQNDPNPGGETPAAAQPSPEIATATRKVLTPELLRVVEKFAKTYGTPS